MFVNPFLFRLNDSKRIIIAGCGGGYDFMSSIPMYEYLTAAGKVCILANLTFTNCRKTTKESTPRLCDGLFEVSSQSKFEEKYGGTYFPEKYMCEYYEKFKEKEDVKVYCFCEPSGGYFSHSSLNVKMMEKCYSVLVEKFDIDTIIISDGGNDSLMRGNEEELGTVVEDMTSIAAVYRVKGVKNDKKFLLSLGFGVDFFHGVRASHVLENISHLIKNTTGGYLGCFSMVKESKEYEVYKNAFEYVNKRNEMISIVGSSIISATDGIFGNYHVSPRTKGSDLYINPLMSIYWCFDIMKLSKQIFFLENIIKDDNKDCWDVGKELKIFRDKLDDNFRPIEKYPH